MLATVHLPSGAVVSSIEVEGCDNNSNAQLAFQLIRNQSPTGDGDEDPVYFLRWELITTARLYDALPADVRRIE
jgi:hypothetical protein